MLKPTELTNEEYILASRNTPFEGIRFQLECLRTRLEEAAFNNAERMQEERDSDIKDSLRYGLERLDEKIGLIKSIEVTFDSAEAAAASIIREHLGTESEDLPEFGEDIMLQISDTREQMKTAEYRLAERGYLKAKAELEQAEERMEYAKVGPAFPADDDDF